MKEFELTEENFAGCVDAATGKPIPKKGDVVLPEKVIYKGEECKLTGIKNGAFSWCKELTSVVIPDGVVSIGESTFYGCDALKSVKIPESVTRIGAGALGECVSLTEIDIPDSVTSIEEGAFSGCTGLTHIKMPDRLISIEEAVCQDCSSLSYVDIPDSVTKIGYGAFAGCTSLTDVDIPDNVTSIGDGAFYRCKKISSVVIPDGLTDIKADTFQDCRKLHSVKIPDSVTRIERAAFAGCISLEKIKVPDQATEIQAYAFKDCVNLTSIAIPDGVKDLGLGALENCSGLKELHLPDDLTFCDALNGCSDDLVINYRGSDITYKAFTLTQEQSDGLEDQKCLAIAKEAADILGKDAYSPVLVSKLCNAEHSGKLEQTAAQIKKDFQAIGFYNIKNSVDAKAKEQLTALFRLDKRSRGVVPKIIDALTIASTELDIAPEDIVKSFEEKKFRDAVMAMRSCNKGNRFCDVEATLFAMNFDVNTVKNVILENPHKDYASVLLCESCQKNDEHLKDLAKWVAFHPDVSQNLVKDIVKYKNSITIDASDNVDAVRAQISRGRALLEIQEIEKSYPDFKFADCKCTLPTTEVELGDYRAYIMDAKDPRQVMIGYDTNCCQDVLMGNGYNEMVNDNIRQFAGMTPPLTGDLLVILDNDNIVGFLNSEYEEKYPNLCDLYEAIAAGEVNTKDLLEEIAPYTDADESCSVLKYSNSVELYFQEAYDNYVKEHGELPEIGSFFSEPSEEDLLAFSRENLSTKDAYVMVSGSRLKDLEDEHEATAPEVTGRCEDMADTREDYDDIDEYL